MIGSAWWKIPFHSTYENFGNSNRDFWSNGTRPLAPNVLLWGQNAHGLEDIEIDEEEVTKLHRHLKNVREHAWRRWQKEYVHSLMEAHRVNRKDKPQTPEIGEIFPVVGENRNRGEWKKAREEGEGSSACKRERRRYEGSRSATQGKQDPTPTQACMPSRNKKLQQGPGRGERDYKSRAQPKCVKEKGS